MSVAPAVGHDGPLALVCGGGTLPLAVAEFVSKRGRAVVLFALRGHADPALVARYPHHWLRVGQLGGFTRLAHAAGCRDVVFIGSLVRPTLWRSSPRFRGADVIAAHHGCLSWRRQSSVDGREPARSRGKAFAFLARTRWRRRSRCRKVCSVTSKCRSSIGKTLLSASIIWTPAASSISGRLWWWLAGACSRWKLPKARTRC